MIWLIQGGLGLGGSVFSQVAEHFRFTNGYDLYVSDDRCGKINHSRGNDLILSNF